MCPLPRPAPKPVLFPSDHSPHLVTILLLVRQHVYSHRHQCWRTQCPKMRQRGRGKTRESSGDPERTDRGSDLQRQEGAGSQLDLIGPGGQEGPRKWLAEGHWSSTLAALSRPQRLMGLAAGWAGFQGEHSLLTPLQRSLFEPLGAPPIGLSPRLPGSALQTLKPQAGFCSNQGPRS